MRPRRPMAGPRKARTETPHHKNNPFGIKDNVASWAPFGDAWPVLLPLAPVLPHREGEKEPKKEGDTVLLGARAHCKRHGHSCLSSSLAIGANARACVDTPRHQGVNCLLSLAAYVKREFILWMHETTFWGAWRSTTSSRQAGESRSGPTRRWAHV